MVAPGDLPPAVQGWLTLGRAGTAARLVAANLPLPEQAAAAESLCIAFEEEIERRRATGRLEFAPTLFADIADDAVMEVVVGVSTPRARAGVVMGSASDDLGWFLVTHSSVGGEISFGRIARAQSHALIARMLDVVTGE